MRGANRTNPDEQTPGHPSNEIEPKPKRRKFTDAYKRKIVAAADAYREPGEIGAILCRDGQYSPLLTTWRAQARTSTLEVMGRKQGPKKAPSTEARRVANLERENQRLRRKLEHAEKVILVQKKLSELLGIELDPPNDDEFEKS